MLTKAMFIWIQIQLKNKLNCEILQFKVLKQHEIVCKYWDLYHLLCHMIKMKILGSPSPRGRYTTQLTGKNVSTGTDHG